MKSLNFARVRNRELSLWQSAVAEYVRKEHFKGETQVDLTNILKHPMTVATSDHASKAIEDENFVPLVPAKDDGSHEALVYKSYLAFQIAEAEANSNPQLVEEYKVRYRKFSDEDWSIGPPLKGFASCASTYSHYKKITGGHRTYHDWTLAGNNNIDYGVIDWKLPNNAKVGILGDWGTGMPDAIALLKDMMLQHKPDAIIHLGDIYYSGTPDECQQYFADVFTAVFDEVLGKGKRIPVFSIPGNHDYYAWGAGYYKVVTGLNDYDGIRSAIQRASYFSLETKDGGWQFLGMDTGFYDSDPKNQFNRLYAGPWLHDSEITWMQDKMAKHDGLTILLSHHQLFSANAAINGKDSVMNPVPYFNPYLYRVFSDYLSTKVAGWIWGHEHNFVMYQNEMLGLAKGRLVGNSAYEELTSADPYKVNYPIPYLESGPAYDKYKLGTNADPNGITYYNHGYAIIDLAGRTLPTDPVTTSYYQFPSWGDKPPVNPKSDRIFKEKFTKPTPPKGNGNKIHNREEGYRMMTQDGMSIQSASSGQYYYPHLAPDTGPATQAVSICLGIGEMWMNLKDGAIVTIYSQEPILKQKNHLYVGSTPWVYYYSPTSDGNTRKNVRWKIHKKYKDDDPNIYAGDPVYIESIEYPGQFLKPVYAKKWSSIYMTTAYKKDFAWRFEEL